MLEWVLVGIRDSDYYKIDHLLYSFFCQQIASIPDKEGVSDDGAPGLAVGIPSPPGPPGGPPGIPPGGPGGPPGLGPRDMPPGPIIRAPGPGRICPFGPLMRLFISFSWFMRAC